MRRSPEEKRLRRAMDEVEKGLARNQCDLVLAGLLQLPDAERLAYRESARQLASAAIAREAALGHPAALVELGRQIAAAKLLPRPPEDSPPEWVEACWKCLWAICERSLDPARGRVGLVGDHGPLARLLFDSLWPALIDRHPALVDATDLFLSLDEARFDDDRALARLRAAIADSSPTAPAKASPVRPDERGSSTSFSGNADLPQACATAAGGWPGCAVNAGPSEARELALGAWSNLSFAAFAAGAREALSKRGTSVAPAEWLAGAAAGILEAACLEALHRLSPSPKEAWGRATVRGETDAEWLWEPLSLVEAALEVKPTLSEAVRTDLCALFRAAVWRSGISVEETPGLRESELLAIRRLGVALLRNDPATFWWIGSWLEAVKTEQVMVARALAPLYREAVERSYTVPLWAKAAQMWDVAFCDGSLTPADKWLEAGARQAVRSAPELAGWLRRATSETRACFLEVISAHLAEAEPLLDSLWELEPNLRRELAGAYFELIERRRETPARLANLRQIAKLMKAEEGEAVDDELLDALEELSDPSFAPPLKQSGIELFKRIHGKAVPYEPRLMLIATELLDDDELLAVGRALVLGGAPIDGCLFAVKVAAIEAANPVAALSLLNETLKRFAGEPAMLAAGFRHALRQGFPDDYLARIWAALESALELRPEARTQQAVKDVLKLRKVKRAVRRARRRREHNPNEERSAMPSAVSQPAAAPEPDQGRLL